MKISSATNARSFVGSMILDEPTIYSICVIQSDDATTHNVSTLLASANSYAFDFAVRLRLGGLNITGYILRDIPTPNFPPKLVMQISRHVASLNYTHVRFSSLWNDLAEYDNAMLNCRWKQMWAITNTERLRQKALLDAIVGYCYGLGKREYAEILTECDYPATSLRLDAFTSTLDPKGFWRVDKDKHPELRHTVLAQVAFQDLQRMGLEAFLVQNDGEGWMLPETLCLADYGLGHDDRAKEAQPVASVLGPRFYDWQLEGTAEESWEECRRHAANLRAIRNRFPVADAEAPAPEGEEGNSETKPNSKKVRKSKKKPMTDDWFPEIG